MTIVIWALAAFCLASLALHLLSTALAVVRCRPARYLTAPSGAPPVSIVRPVCGIDNHAEETLRSTFALDYPGYEILFCVAAARDPIVPLVRRLIADHPSVPARLLVGDDRISDNPKLNNVVKGWRAAAHDSIVIADSNVLMPRDLIQRLFATRRADTGLVCSPPVGCLPEGIAAEIECAFLNTYQARWQYAADAAGLGYAQGKTMLWRRPDLERAGGLRALASEPAEDAAATKVVRAQGLRVRLVDGPFGQPLGVRTLKEVWRRQVRWARLRRVTFKSLFALEILSTSLPLLLAAALLSDLQGYSPWSGAAAVAIVWYGAEALLAYVAGWHLTLRSPLAWLARDLLLPALWLEGWRGNEFSWRGNAMTVAESARNA